MFTPTSRTEPTRWDAPLERLERPGVGCGIDLQERWPHAIEGVRTIADEQLKEGRLLEPAPGAGRQPGQPIFRRMHIVNAKLPDGHGLEIADGVQECWALLV